MNNEEYSRIVNQYTDIVYRVALSYAKSKPDAEDVVQTTFMKLLIKEVNFQDEEHIRKWLIRVAINECNSLWSSFWRKHVDFTDKIEQEPKFTTEEKSDLYYAVMELPRKYRVVVHLFYYEGYSTKEISQILHIREATVRTQLVRARKQLKQRLKEDWKNE